MIERPDIKPLPEGDILIFDTARVRPKHDWRFMGWLTIGAMTMVILNDVQRWRLGISLLDVMLPVLGLIVGVVLIRVMGEEKFIQRPLLHISDDRAYVTRCTPSGEQQHSVASLTHVVFGMIDYPWPDREGVNVEAYALYLAQADGTPIPVIDASTDKLRTFQLAQTLAGLLDRKMIQMGKGILPDETIDVSNDNFKF